MMQQLIPLKITPEVALGVSRSLKICDGLWIKKLSEATREGFKAWLETAPDIGAEMLKCTHAVVVDNEEYATACSKRLKTPINPQWVSGRKLAVMIMTAVTLHRGVHFWMSGSFTHSTSCLEHRGKLQASSWGSALTEQIPLQSPLQIQSIHQTKQLSKRQLKRTALALESYYQFEPMRVNRVSAALRHLWSALCTPYTEQSVLSASAGIEALFNTGQTGEINHQIAERMAMLIGRTIEERHRIYKRMKQLYGLRSTISHGNAMRKRKQKDRWMDALLLTPTVAHASASELRDLIRFLMHALKCFLHDDKLTQITSMKQDDEALRKYFQSRLLS